MLEIFQVVDQIHLAERIHLAEQIYDRRTGTICGKRSHSRGQLVYQLKMCQLWRWSRWTAWLFQIDMIQLQGWERWGYLRLLKGIDTICTSRLMVWGNLLINFEDDSDVFSQGEPTILLPTALSLELALFCQQVLYCIFVSWHLTRSI